MARSKRRNVTKFRWTKELIVLLVVLVVMISATVVLGIPSKTDEFNKKYAGAMTSEQTALTENSVYSEISYNKLVDKIKKDEYTYVYYGSITVSAFLDNMENVNQRAQEYEVDDVYILESTWAEKLNLEDEEDGKENQDKLSEREAKLDNVDMKTYPSLWVFKNGKVIFDSKTYLEDSYEQASWAFVIEQAFSNPERLDAIEKK